MIMIEYLIGCLLSAILVFIYYWKYAKQYKTGDIPVTILFVGLSWIAIIIEAAIIAGLIAAYISEHWTKVLRRSKK